MRNKKQQGFTLIELLVVIAIIGLLASVVLLALNSARQKSRDAKRVADVRQMQSGLELYFNDCSSYPVNAGVILDATKKMFQGSGANCGTNDGSGSANGGIGAVAATVTAGMTTYLAQFPAAPKPADTATCQAATTTPVAVANDYRYIGTATSYSLKFCLGGVTGGLAAGTGTATEGGITQP